LQRLWDEFLRAHAHMSEVYASQTRAALYGTNGPINKTLEPAFFHTETGLHHGVDELGIVFRAKLTMENVMDCGAAGMAAKCHLLTQEHPGPRAILVRPYEDGLIIVGFAKVNTAFT